ncbi:NADPH-dependent ferric-chelate reductase [Frondihabitans sp. 762G35]|uniref:siderophore-interacting protein n=1 Tax=Frondihabitans sp. 762G35 TaxID=1446794 RepID=UPI000D21ACCA|nr:siderophore-interacting protein [Frondihabitans sp. 762G35]ARC58528.1 NADPH-dependent ferric-chelate reductase [Frondihabitans sp. 762G35]
MFRAAVVRSERVTPSVQRVTVAGDELDSFDWVGFDQWFRLFLRRPGQEELIAPPVTGSGWWPAYLAMPEEHRPHCANYTVADFRPRASCPSGVSELDIDFVVHRGPDGALEGRAAIWACGARPGEPVVLLDQGVLFDAPSDASSVLVVAEETGLPAAVGIARSLPQDAVGRLILEVPTAADRRPLHAPAGVEVTWVVRAEPAAVPGAAALAALREHVPADDRGYAFVVGESTLATAGRRHLHRAGLPKSRITFSGFWKHEARVPAHA